MTNKDKELLAGFHHTLSEQLNSRLAESPKFFGLLVVVATGYGYVLSKQELRELTAPATALSLATTLWASWYLAALGYAFRFLQHSQRHIETQLGWSPYTFSSGKPPDSRKPFDWFWLLPGIYHANAAGLSVFFVLICFTGLHGNVRWVGMAIGISLIIWMNQYYFSKYKDKYQQISEQLRLKGR